MKQKIAIKKKLTNYVKLTQQDMIKEKLLLNRLSEDLNSDILKIDSKNISFLFYNILGFGEDRLQKQNQDMLRARLKYDSGIRYVDYLGDELKKLNEELLKVEVSENEYEHLIDEQILILGLDDDEEKSEEIKELIKRNEDMKSNINDIDSAIIKGENSLAEIEKTIDFLEAANRIRSANIVDNSQESIRKQENMDQAAIHAENSKILLYAFKRELSNIQITTNDEILVKQFELFSDKFFDSLIYDWAVQFEISKTLDVVKNIKNKIDAAISRLYEDKFTQEVINNHIGSQINKIIKIKNNKNLLTKD